jgi:hypothetical protein
MNDRRSKDRLYTAVVSAFLIGLVGLGLLGVPALLVAAIGAVVAAVGIAAFHHRLVGNRTLSSGHRTGRQKVPAKYVPSVLETSSTKRRQILHLRRRRDPQTPLRFR